MNLRATTLNLETVTTLNLETMRPVDETGATGTS